MPLRMLPDDEPAPQAPRKPGAIEDVLRSLLAGAERGAASVPGLLGDVQSGLESAAVWGRRQLAGDEEAEALRQSQQTPFAKRVLPTTEEVVTAAQPYVPGIDYKPQTTAGEYARTGAEFTTGAALTAPLGGARTAAQVGLNALTTGLIPGLASEAAGQLTEGTAAEPWARTGAALVAGVGGAMASAPSTADNVVRQAMGRVTPAQVDAAEQLFMQAESMGVPLSRAQALAAVTNGATSLPDIQRVVEGSGAMRGFYAPTAQGVDDAGRRAIDTIAPTPRNPSTIGPAAAEAAEEGLDRARTRMNTLTRPNYERVGMTDQGYMAIPAEDMDVLMQQPLYRDIIEEIRRDPSVALRDRDLPDASIPFNDLIQRRMGERLEQVDPTRALSPSQRTGTREQRALVREAMDTATGGEMGTIWAEQTRLRRRYLDPLMQGPLGKLAKAQDTEGAIGALFPQGRYQPSAGEISQAVSRVVNSTGGEVVAPQLVRAYLESTFDQATKQLQGGPNQWGGATFNAMVRGNPQMHENLRAAITSLPNGQETWTGFERFLDVMQATGTRQRMGSATSFNNELVDQIKTGGLATDVAKTATGSPLALPQRIRDQIDRINMGHNTQEIARLLTDPRAAARFRQLAQSDPASPKALRLVGSLVATAQRARNADEEYGSPRGSKLRLVD